MQLHEAFKLKEAHNEDHANRAIQDEGWQLLAVTPGVNGVTYVLGKKKPAAEPERTPLTPKGELALEQARAAFAGSV